MKTLLPCFPAYPPCVAGTVSCREDWEKMRSCPGECDMLEWRIDLLLEELSFSEISEADKPGLPVLLTIRAAEEGGAGKLSLEQRRSLYLALLPLADAIDVEIASLEALSDIVQAAKERGMTIIGSAHHFETTFSEKEIREKDRIGRALGADVIKIAHRLTTPDELSIGHEWLAGCRKAALPAALMGMGDLGPVSRLLAAQSGSCLVYGYLGQNPTAPGQLSAAEFKKLLPLLNLLPLH